MSTIYVISKSIGETIRWANDNGVPVRMVIHMKEIPDGSFVVGYGEGAEESPLYPAVKISHNAISFDAWKSIGFSKVVENVRQAELVLTKLKDYIRNPNGADWLELVDLSQNYIFSFEKIKA